MHLINAQYRILDVFEKNPLQSLMLGSSLESPEDIVVINEVIWSPLFTRELAESLFDGFINLKTHSEDDASCQLITAYHKGMPIGKYMASRSLPFRNRINLSYEFLKNIVSYDKFPPWVQDILIDEDQIIVDDDQLLYNELLVMKTSDAGYSDKIPFSRVQKKIHKVLGNLIGNSKDASPALISFLERLSSNAVELGTLQAIYDDFQKVYLYDYYLDKDDTKQPTPSAIVVPVPLMAEENSLPEDEGPENTEPGAESAESPADFPDNGIPQDAAAVPIPPVPEEDPLAIPVAPEMDSVDEDMEKNLELFFNRDRAGADAVEEKENMKQKSKKWFWILLGIIGIILMLWVAVNAFSSNGKPVASFTSVQKDGIWQLQNTSTFTKKTSLKRSEWTVFQNGSLIQLYDTNDLTLSLEDEGAYQVVLRVMDSNGKWSSLTKKTLENHLSGKAPATTDQNGNGANPAAGGSEKMDQFTYNYTPERTEKDTSFFRTGSYSLKVTPGSSDETIEVKGVVLDKNGMVSIWIASENTKAVSLSFTGYNQNTKVFSKEVTHKPIAPLQWEMIQFTVESDKAVNRMTISVDTNSLIHLDDLSIESYK